MARDESAKIRLTTKENDFLVEQSSKQGISKSEYIRELIKKNMLEVLRNEKK